MDQFVYRGGILHAEDVDLRAIAQEVGTPVYCYSRAGLEERYHSFTKVFASVPSLLCYAIKANSNQEVIATLARLGAGMDVVSEGELRRARAAGVSADKIVFSGIGKTESEMTFALNQDILCFNVESEPELEKLAEHRVCQAREEGRAEGEAQAKARAEEEVRSTIERLAAAIAEIDQYRGQLLRQTETDAVRLSIAIARRVLRRELTVDPGAIEGLVRAALERLQSQESCKVRMHPEFIPALRDCVERMGMESRVEIIPDAAQEPGAAVFEMSRGCLNASIDSQLKEIERGLVDRFQTQR